MNTQDRLSDLDRMKNTNFKLRQQLLNNEVETFYRDVFAAYGNPGEQLAIGPNGELTRTPESPVVPPAEVTTPPAKTRKKPAK